MGRCYDRVDDTDESGQKRCAPSSSSFWPVAAILSSSQWNRGVITLDERTKLLLVEDEPGLAGFMKWELEHEGYDVEWCTDGRQGLDAALRDEDWAIILLDVLLPALNGIEVCRRVRIRRDTPIIMITARDAVPDRVAGLDSGADDYIIKPFAIEEVFARIRALIRRNLSGQDDASSDILQVEDLILNRATRDVTRAQVAIELTAREFDLLEVFMNHPNHVLSRQELLETVWGYDFEVETNVVDVYVRYLRQKIEIEPEHKLIQTIRGVGYILKSDPHDSKTS